MKKFLILFIVGLSFYFMGCTSSPEVVAEENGPVSKPMKLIMISPQKEINGELEKTRKSLELLKEFLQINHQKNPAIVGLNKIFFET